MLCCYRATMNSLRLCASVSMKRAAFRDVLQPPTPACCASLMKYSHQPPPRPPGFFGKLVENIKEEYNKSKEMKESLKKFREDAEKLEQSDALKQARRKFQTIEAETTKSSQVLRDRLSTVKEKLEETLEEVQKSDIGKKAGKISEELSKTARSAAGTISETGEQLSKSTAFKSISEGVKAVKEEVESSAFSRARIYQRPDKLRKREEAGAEAKVFEANTEATGVELHKDSRWYQSWEQLKNNNPMFNKVLDWKVRYDESSNPMVRATRLLTDKVTDIMGNMFQKTDLSQTLTEICKMDPSFDKEQFIRECEAEIIPNILEAIIQGELEVLRDWCYEAPFNVIATPLKEAKRLGCTFHSKILDVSHVDLVMGKIMEQGPVLVISFQSQQIMCLKDRTGKTVEGDEEKVLRVNYVWVLCRDQGVLNPKAAWKLLDLSAHSTQQLL